MGFSDIFSVKSVDNIVDAVIDTGDALIYTDEEKAKAEQLKVDTKLKMLPLYEPFQDDSKGISIYVYSQLHTCILGWHSVILLVSYIP